MNKTAEKEYLFDPEEAGVVLDTSGNPTSKGWELVTPGGWEFRWSVGDKIMVPDPGDPALPSDHPGFYQDREWYIDVTRDLIYWQVRQEDPNGSIVSAVAETIKRYLEQIDTRIRPHEALAGVAFNDEHGIRFSVQSHPYTGLLRCKELAGRERICTWTGNEKHSLSDEDWKHLEELAEKSNMAMLVRQDMTEDEWNMYYHPTAPGRYFEPFGGRGLRCNPDHDWYLRKGLRALIDEVKERLDRYNIELKHEESAPQSSVQKIDELKDKIENAQAQIKASEAVVGWIKRYAEKAGEMASSMPDKESREIAEGLADVCGWVAENPPRDFWESMQLHWFLFMVYWNIECSSHTVTYLPDRIHWDWYKKSVLEKKSISKTRASEIIMSYGAKYAELAGNMVRWGGVERGVMGTRDGSVVTIGGIDSDGKDGFNELSRLWINTFDGYRLHFPDIKIRWHHVMPKEDFRRAIEVARTGMGLPSFRNDNVVIPSMMDMYPGEITLKDARNWAVVGCNTPGTTIDSKGAPKGDAYYPQVTKAVEFALFNGRDPEPGFEWFKSIETGDSREFKDFEEFYQAWLKQWEWIVTTEVNLRNRAVRRWEETTRRPVASLLYKACQENGEDIAQYKGSPWCSFQSIVGWVDSIDSLAAVKYCVYDKKMYTMDELLKALKAEWEGYEKMQADFKAAPKFGNDDDRADNIMVRATGDVYNIQRNVLDARGKPVFVNALPLSMIWMMAPYIGALPNGRKRGEVFADSGIAPHAEFDKSGPFARIRSALKIDQTRFKAYIYNMRFDYDSVAGVAGLDKLADYTWDALMNGQSQMQFNFVSPDLLRAAQKEPEKHQALSVRISGWSAYFVPLPEFMQEAIIARTEHRLS